MALPPQQFCVRWNSYHTNLQAVFPRLLLTEQFADVTLACESRQLRCHKLVLSACSAYLERLLLQNPCKHPIVLMKDMRFSEMQALVDFMYKGEVNVTQEELPSLLKSAEALQIRGLCSGDSAGLVPQLPKAESKDFACASDALVAHAQAHAAPAANGPTSQQHKSSNNNNNSASTTNGPKKRKSEERERDRERERERERSAAEVKEETVEEDGLYYGELDHDNMEYQEDEDSAKPGSSLGQASDMPIANVQCHYERDSSPEPEPGPEPEAERYAGPPGDHTYDTRDEPPAFIIQQVQSLAVPYVEVTPKVMTLGTGYVPSVNVIHVGDGGQVPQSPQSSEYNINKRIRRSEVVLRQAADCVSRGSTFQTVSEKFNIPISTIRFFMARKGILPKRRRGRNTHINSNLVRACTSPEPPYHMQHYKLPDMVALPSDLDSPPPPTL